ncbi:MAG: O-antigen ligase family protein, partial [Planctomycetota bacterium]
MYNKLFPIAVGIFLLLIVITPWLIGGVIPGVFTVGLLIVSLLGMFCLLTSATSHFQTSLSFAIKMVLLATIGYALLQMVPWFGGPISKYSVGTQSRVAELTLGLGAFLIASQLFRNQFALSLFFAVIAANGFVLTFFGLAQSLSGTDKIFGLYELIHGGKAFGPFVNENNAGGYLLLCLAAANFFLAQRVFSLLHRSKTQTTQLLDEISPWEQFKNNLGLSFAELETRQLYVLASITMIMVGVVATFSRGAMVAMAISLFVGWGLLARRNVTFGIVACLIVIAGVGVLAWTQQTTMVASTLDSLTDIETSSQDRISHWQDGWQCALAYLPFGCGLGNYHFSYLPFQQKAFTHWFQYAENQYLQTLAEMGIPGLILLLTAIAIMIRACLILLGRPDSVSRSGGLTGLLAVVSQMVAGLFDFGTYMPGNMVLMAAICGAIFSQLDWSWVASRPELRLSSVGFNWKVRLVFLIMLLLSAWSAYKHSGVDARQLCRRFYERFDPERDAESLPFFQRLAEYSIKVEPNDAEAHYQLALNHVLQYRMEASYAMVKDVQASIDQSRDLPLEERPFPDDFQFGLAEAFPRSTLLAIHGFAKSAQLEDETLLAQLKDSELVQQNLVPAWKHLNIAKDSYDQMWFAHLGLASLCLLMDAEEREQPLVEDAIRLSRDNSEVLYASGVIQLQSGNNEAACEVWRRCLKNSKEFEAAIIQFCRVSISVKEFFEKVLPEDPNYQLRIVKKYFNSPDDRLIRKMMLGHTEQAVSRHELPEAERQFLLGEIARLSENYSVSIHHFRKALEMEKRRVLWRIQFARALIAAEYFEEALTELKMCEFYEGGHSLTCQRLKRAAIRQRDAKVR